MWPLHNCILFLVNLCWHLVLLGAAQWEKLSDLRASAGVSGGR